MTCINFVNMGCPEGGGGDKETNHPEGAEEYRVTV
jgi:hypothetical protein